MALVAPSVAAVVPMKSFMPAFAMAMVVFLIKFPVIVMAAPVPVPIGIMLVKTLPVMRMALIPRIPPGSIPVFWSHDKGGRISVIRGPPVPLAEKVIQDPVQKPIPVVINPRRIRPDPGCGVDIRGRGRIIVGGDALGIRRG
jgi:hypothetical protein